MNYELLKLINDSISNNGGIALNIDDYYQVYESARVDNKIVSFKEIHSLLDKNRVSHTKVSKNEYDMGNSEICRIILYFPEFDNTQFDNTLKYTTSIGYSSNDSPTIYTYENTPYKGDAYSFFGFKPNKIDGSFSVSDIVEKCDSERIYRLYKSKALDYVKIYEPRSYYLFQRIKEIRGGVDTLCVYYNNKTRSFIYRYNPDFILESALSEFLTRESSYNSLEACYLYNLSFFILHEMMHIISSNSVSAERVEDSVTDYSSSNDHRVSNIIQDGYINTHISTLFFNQHILPTKDRLMSMNMHLVPSIGIGTAIQLRSEINGKGFKKFYSSSEVSDKITSVIVDMLKRNNINSAPYQVSNGNNTEVDKYEGKSFMISIEVNSNNFALRSSSYMYQKTIDALMRVFTDDNYHSASDDITQDEFLKALDNIKPGTYVRVKSTGDVCIVNSYDKEKGVFSLNKAKIDGVLTHKGDLYTTYRYRYSATDEYWGEAYFYDIEVIDFNSEANSWTDKPKTERSGLSQEERTKADDIPLNILTALRDKMGSDNKVINLMKEISNLLNKNLSLDDCKELYSLAINKENKECISIIGEDMFNELSNYYNNNYVKVEDSQGEESTETKSISIGDIVYIKSKSIFGKILSLDSSTGMYQIQEVIEKEPEIVDSYSKGGER